MNTTNPQKIIENIFRQFGDFWYRGDRLSFINANDTENLGLHFCIETHVSNFGFEKDGNTHHPEWERRHDSYLHIIVTARRHVFMVVSGTHKLEEIPALAFENTSNHDDCWSSDGLDCIQQEAFHGYRVCWNQEPPIPDEHVPAPLAANISQRFGSIFGSEHLVQYVRTTEVWDDEKNQNSSGYWRKLSSIRKVKFTMTVED